MIKVASYCRVSTDREDQANSFESQKRYFTEYIQRHPEWELYKVYADEGISGTSTKKRTQFNRMINDAYSEKFKWIITKEVSRFSRNLLDTIRYTRELKALGIGVIFANDGFTSIDPDSELRLSIMGSIAQEESRKTSSRVKWGQTRQMERGVVFGTSMLGYDVHNGEMTVNQEGAEVVKLIFYKYAVEQKGTSVIAKELREEGIRTYTGNVIWNSSQILKILRNEKYAGDLIQKKTFTPDYLSHVKKTNRGEEERITILNHHEPIIERALWNTAQKEIEKRSGRNRTTNGHSNRYLFSGKMICGECGATFIARTKTRKNGTSYRRWSCRTAAVCGADKTDSAGNLFGCDIGKTIRDDLAMDALILAVKSLPCNLDRVICNLAKLVAAEIQNSAEECSNKHKIDSQLKRSIKKKEFLLDNFLSGAISKEEFQHMKDLYDRNIKALKEALETFKQEISPQSDENLAEQIQSIITCEKIEELFLKELLEKITIQKEGILQVKLKHIPQIWNFRIDYQKTKIN